MALETRLALKTTQRLVMTAMLQQAIKLLPLSRLELIQKIHQEMLENPFLDDAISQEEDGAETTEEEISPEAEEEPRVRPLRRRSHPKLRRSHVMIPILTGKSTSRTVIAV